MDNRLLTLPPLDALRGFVAVARRLSITQAANDLCLTQSVVSRQILALEESLGTPLFIRKHRALALSDAGERLIPRSCGFREWLLSEVRHTAEEMEKYLARTLPASVADPK